MKNITVSQRLKSLMESRNLRQVDILRAAEPYCVEYGVPMKKNALSQYISGKVVPGRDRLMMLGLALGVSEAWLMGYDVPMERNVTPNAVCDGRTKEIMDLFGRLSTEHQDVVISVAKGLQSKR